MEKSMIKIEFDQTAIQGIAIFNEKQAQSLTFSGAPRLRRDLSYVVPRQWVHNSKLTKAYMGHEFSKKVFAFGLDAEGRIVTITTVAVSALKGSFYAKVVPGQACPRISAVNNNGVMRAASGASQESVFSHGGVEFRELDSKVYVGNTICFTAGDKEEVWVGNLSNIGSTENPKWSMATEEIEGQSYLQLSSVLMRMFDEITCPAVDMTEEGLGKEIWDRVRMYMSELPEL